MSRVNKLRLSRDSYAVKYKEFLRIFAKDSNIAIFFFEGEDIKYYRFRINTHCPSLHWVGLNCGGKATVLNLRKLISQNAIYSKAKTKYFLDRDFDEIDTCQEHDNTYITPCYSIENLYVTERAFCEVLKGEFGYHKFSDDGNFEIALDLFKKRFYEFLDAVQELNSWILYHRQMERQGVENRTKLNLQSLNLNQWIGISLSKVESHLSIRDLESRVQGAQSVTNEEIEMLNQTFQPDRRYLDFRGKFQAYFMRVFLTKLIEDSCRSTPNFLPCKKQIHFNVSDKNFLSDLCQYAETPPCLESFLAKIS